jgi:sensor domain CHASE-containing protein
MYLSSIGGDNMENELSKDTSLDMIFFRDKLQKLFYVSDAIRMAGYNDAKAIYFLQLEIDELQEQYSKVEEKIEDLI